MTRSPFKSVAGFFTGAILLTLAIISFRIERSPYLLGLQGDSADYPCIGASMDGAPIDKVRGDIAVTIAYSMGTENWIGLPFVELKNLAYLAIRFSDTKINRMFASGHRYPYSARLSFDQVASRVYGRRFCQTAPLQRSAIVEWSGDWERGLGPELAIWPEIERMRALGIEQGFNVRE